ncbi:SDR family oxidoreductase [Aliiglaciecola sp. 2_MG-2023]|uniref:SDR family oxidoreductase n=1 Tax=unclassified Aliiglaciecola TaxID=2593648 RepID=UPI0026E460DA|nr:MULTISPECIES: SDR family oxidoreductase [unclassified Aliiglaciecola]MDO6709376.1 SDR family oxidoreductase [Aliiglaciecola sp. 2_MG-2023]MDO6750524.1 SDR family oxidoreductase [Aliiglaciecola sp. 1_MG-2023]
MKKVILTGANGQLGRSYIQVLMKTGFHVIAVDTNIENLVPTENLDIVELDITNASDVTHFYEKIEDIYALVNNAGIGVFTPFENRTPEEFMSVLEVNLLGTFLMCQGAIKNMKNRQEGKIVNIGSIYGVVSSDERIYGQSQRNNSEVYSMSKAGVIQLTKYMAAHFGKHNIQTNTLSPGGTFNNQSKDFVYNYEQKTPMGRMASPEDLHSALLFLLDEKSNYVNGQNIVVDGGFTSW